VSRAARALRKKMLNCVTVPGAKSQIPRPLAPPPSRRVPLRARMLLRISGVPPPEVRIALLSLRTMVLLSSSGEASFTCTVCGSPPSTPVLNIIRLLAMNGAADAPPMKMPLPTPVDELPTITLRRMRGLVSRISMPPPDSERPPVIVKESSVVVSPSPLAIRTTGPVPVP